MTDALPATVKSTIDAINAHDLESFLEHFADDAIVNDHHRLIRDKNEIRSWAQTEMIGSNLALNVESVRDHHGDFIVTGRAESSTRTGTIALYFSLRGDTIVRLVAIPFAGLGEARAA